uniref:Uncharacterized protein n=1 Tax=Timema shepardi TaxID=629360 RepID=A0A7R9AQM9_TIMSH|nr:unnamed protein product [Timema shepardi]
MLAILTVCEESVQPVSQQFFNITFPGAALGDTAVRNTAEELLMSLGQMEGPSPPHLLYSRHAGSMFQDLQLSLDTWIFNSPQRSIFQTLVEKLVSYDGAGPYLGIISSLMVHLTGTDKDPRVKLSVYTSLSLLLDTKGCDELDTFCVTVVREAGQHSDKSSLNGNIDARAGYRQHDREVALRVSHSSLMSSDRMKPRSGDWAVTIEFLQEATITSLSSGSSALDLIINEFLTGGILCGFQDVILPGLVWQAGRTAETVRTSAVACLWAALRDPVPPSMVRVTDMCLPLVLGLVEDSARKTRLVACRVLRVLVQLMRREGRLNADLIHQVFPGGWQHCSTTSEFRSVVFVGVGVKLQLVKAVKTVVALYTPLPADYDVQCSSALVDALYTTMLVHLDDPDPIFQGVMLDALKDLSHIHPRLLWEKLNNSLGNFRNTKDCSELLEHIKSLRDTSAT